MDIASDAVKEELLCVICKRMFRMEKNISAWKCRMHPGNISSGRWNCCGMSSNGKAAANLFYTELLPESMRGCTPCDHRVDYTSYNETNGMLDISFRLLDIYKIPYENARIVGEFNEVYVDANIVRIARYDWRKKEDVWKKYKMRENALKIKNKNTKTHAHIH